jgi:2-succinyl-5-enolpyruvyl-6-hydroxy-3-cyclohexene-1-carboxylate synthase
MAAADHPETDLMVNIDERASAFHAVGFARATGRAAAVICTSGTAVADYLPAIIEAYQSRLPIVVLTADRPEELQDCGANQTINQVKIFGKYAVADMAIPAPSENSDSFEFLEKLDCLLNKTFALQGPVHINFRFREPLAPTEKSYDHERLTARMNEWYQQAEANNTRKISPVDGQTVEEIAALINTKKNGLIIAGPEVPHRASRMIRELSEKLQWPVAADILSQCRHTANGNHQAYYDLFLDIDKTIEDLRPDIIMHIGGLPTSRRLMQFLLKHKGVDYIKLQDHDRTIDPDNLETKRIVCRIDEFIKVLMSRIDRPPGMEYLQKWKAAEETCARFLEAYFRTDNLSESSLSYRLASLLNDGQALFLSNSMPVRDADTFTTVHSKNILIGANRGASGIDGVIASACGFAAGSGRPTALVIGDLAFIHDLNSLAMADKSKIPVVIIVINNDGGGIFHFLPIAQFSEHFEKCFTAPHGLGFEKAASLFDLPYYHPQTAGEFEADFHKSIDNGHSAVIEVTSDRIQNIKEHEDIRSQVKNLLSH